VAALVAMAAAPALSAADWPQFRGPTRDGVAPDVRLPATWPKELTKRWEAPLGEGFGSPAVAQGRVFVLAQEGRDEVAIALEAATGKTVWRHAWSARYSTGLAGTGPRATATVDGERVYTIGATGEMYCFAAADGKVLWQKSFRAAFRFRTPTYGFSSSPLVDGERVIVQPGARDGASVVALDKKTGDVAWTSQNDPPGYASPIIVPASPTRGPRQLVVFTELGLVSLNPDTGGFYWRYDWQTSYEQNVAQPMLDGDRLVITTLSGCAALQLAKERDQPVAREVWRNDNLLDHFSCAVTQGGYLYGVHSRRPTLRCLELSDGRVRWSQPLPASERAGIVLADGHLLVYTDTGDLVVCDAAPAGYRERARYALAGRNWVPPVIAQGCLFLRDKSTLRCLVLPKP
jgi:outer membrane protein assembly factor BamB